MKKLYYLLIAIVGVCMVACGNDDGVDNSQSKPEVPEPDKITLSKQTIEVGFESDTYSVNVTSPYSWDAVSKNDWIVVESPTGIAGTEQLSFNIARNEEEKVRKGIILLINSTYNLAAEFYITQAAFVPEISIAPKTLNFSAIGGEECIAVTANFEHKAATDAEWLSITKTEEGYVIKASANPELEERTAEVVISNEKYGISEIIQITQKGQNEKQLIYYTSINSSVVTPNNSSAFGANIISNTYKNGIGVILFDGEVSTIGYMAFAYCDSLTSVTIPDSVTTIGSAAFRYCSSLTSVIIPDSATTIGDCAFANCSNLTSVTIGDSVTSIGYGAFYECISLTSVTIPDGVTTIGYMTFYNCSSLTSVTIPDSVTTIGFQAFSLCNSLNAVHITDLKSWCNIDFINLFTDGSVDLSTNPLSYASNLYLNGELVTDLVIPDGVNEIKLMAFAGCNSIKSVTIPDGATTIGDWVFCNCSSLTSVTIGDSVTTIGEAAFFGCDSLTSVTIGDSVTSIGYGAFYDCRSLTSVTIGDSVTSIGEYAFSYCSSLTSVTIGDSVTTIGGGAFYYCSSLTSVYCKAITPPAGGLSMFYNNASGRKIYVPMESVEAYKSAYGWREYADAIVGYDFELG